MNFDKAIILVLLFTNLVLLHTNRELSNLVDEACELIRKINDLNLKLLKLTGRSDNG